MISIIVSSMNRLFPAAALATTAATMGWESEVFFTFWGPLSLKEKAMSQGGSAQTIRVTGMS